MTEGFTTATLAYWVTAFVLVMTRVSTFFVVFPLFRAARVPRLVKVSFSLALSALWLGSLAKNPHVVFPDVSADHWIVYGIALAREAIVGAALGYVFGLFFLPAEIAGSYLGQEMGLSMASVTNPSSGTSTNVVGELLAVLAMLVFFGSDVHHLVFGTLYSSFAKVPIGAPLQMFQVSTFSLGLSHAERWGLQLAAPIGVILFLTTVLLSIMIRTSPQLNLFSVGITIRIGVGLVASLVLFPEILAMVGVVFSNVSSFVERTGM